MFCVSKECKEKEIKYWNQWKSVVEKGKERTHCWPQCKEMRNLGKLLSENFDDMVKGKIK